MTKSPRLCRVCRQPIKLGGNRANRVYCSPECMKRGVKMNNSRIRDRHATLLIEGWSVLTLRQGDRVVALARVSTKGENLHVQVEANHLGTAITQLWKATRAELARIGSQEAESPAPAG